MHLFNKKSAFTLAEVMVTLGLVGCVAALTLPTLTYNYKGKVLEQQFRSTYSELREVGATISLEKGDIGEYAKKVGMATWDRELMSYFGGSKISNANSNSGITQALRDIYHQGNAPQGPFQFSITRGPVQASIICDNDGIWIDNKGRIWTFNSENNFACVDINGMAAPNRINVDIFVFKPMSSKEMAVWQYNDTVDNAQNYSSAIVPCDLDRLTRWNSPNGAYANNNKCPCTGTDCCNGDTVYEYRKGSGTGVDACPYNEPIENIAPQKKKADGTIEGNGTSAKGRTMTTSNNYWTDYINYK